MTVNVWVDSVRPMSIAVRAAVGEPFFQATVTYQVDGWERAYPFGAVRENLPRSGDGMAVRGIGRSRDPGLALRDAIENAEAEAACRGWLWNEGLVAPPEKRR